MSQDLSNGDGNCSGEGGVPDERTCPTWERRMSSFRSRLLRFAAAICIFLKACTHPPHSRYRLGMKRQGKSSKWARPCRKHRVGDRVTIEPVIACGKCEFCVRGNYHLCANVSFQYRKGQGAFAPFFVASEDRVFKLPDHLSYEEGALIEPLAVALHAVKKSGICLGQTCAVFGAGAIGLLVAMLVHRTTGRGVFIVDINSFRLQSALELWCRGGY